MHNAEKTKKRIREGQFLSRVYCLIWPIRKCAAGQGMAFYLSVLNRVYNFMLSLPGRAFCPSS